MSNGFRHPMGHDDSVPRCPITLRQTRSPVDAAAVAAPLSVDGLERWPLVPWLDLIRSEPAPLINHLSKMPARHACDGAVADLAVPYWALSPSPQATGLWTLQTGNIPAAESSRFRDTHRLCFLNRLAKNGLSRRHHPHSVRAVSDRSALQNGKNTSFILVRYCSASGTQHSAPRPISPIADRCRGVARRRGGSSAFDRFASERV